MTQFELPRRPRLPLTTTQAWVEYVNTPDPPDPPRLDRGQIAELSSNERNMYNEVRLDHHANLGPFDSPQVQEFRGNALRILRSNVQDATRMRPSFALDGAAGSGKSTAVKLFGREVWRKQLLRGVRTADGNARIPVTRITLKGSNTERAINEALAVSYTGAAVGRGAAPALDRFCRYARAAETVLVIVDDFHHLSKGDPVLISNHFKGIAEEVPATFLFVGVGIAQMQFWDENVVGENPSLSQTSRRWALLTMGSPRVRTQKDRVAWVKLLRTIDKHIILANYRRGTLPAMAETLFERTQGHMQTLFDAVNQATFTAIDNGSEQLNETVFESLTMSRAAVNGREVMESARQARLRKVHAEGDLGVGISA